MNQPTGDRLRWISAVLILSGIVGVAALVRQWPARSSSLPPAPMVVSRSIPVFDAPSAPVSSRVREMRREVRQVARPPADQEGRAHTVREEIPARDAAPRVYGRLVDETDAVPPVLASRSLGLPHWPTAMAPAPSGPADDSPRVVERPVVTRAFIVAGRSITNGLRATGAAIKAAF